MVTVNNRKIRFQNGITVNLLLKLLKDDDRFNQIINGTTTVIINKSVVSVSDYDVRIIHDEDIIFMYPALVGG